MVLKKLLIYCKFGLNNLKNNMDNTHTAEEWLCNLPLQTLTDELKQDIIDKFEEEKLKYVRIESLDFYNYIKSGYIPPPNF